MNTGIALLGIVGGLVVGIGLAVQARRDRSLDEWLSTHGVTTTATVAAVVATGRHLAFRRVTFALDDGTTFLQTFPFVEADRLGLEDGARAEVRIAPDDPPGPVRGRLVATPTNRGVALVPVSVGLFIAALGVVAGLVV